MITVKQLQNALWQAYYHGELDSLALAIADKRIDGNDHICLEGAAIHLLERIKDEIGEDEKSQ